MTGPVEFDLNGIWVIAHYFSDLIQALLGFIKKCDQLCVVGAQEPDGSVYGGMPGFLLYYISVERRLTVFDIGHDPFGVHGGRIQLFLSKKRDTAGADDGIEPGAEFGFAAEIGQGAIGFHEDVLADLFGIFAVVREAKHEGEHKLLIALDQLAI